MKPKWVSQRSRRLKIYPDRVNRLNVDECPHSVPNVPIRSWRGRNQSRGRTSGPRPEESTSTSPRPTARRATRVAPSLEVCFRHRGDRLESLIRAPRRFRRPAAHDIGVATLVIPPDGNTPDPGVASVVRGEKGEGFRLIKRHGPFGSPRIRGPVAQAPRPGATRAPAYFTGLFPWPPVLGQSGRGPIPVRSHRYPADRGPRPRLPDLYPVRILNRGGLPWPRPPRRFPT